MKVIGLHLSPALCLVVAACNATTRQAPSSPGGRAADAAVAAVLPDPSATAEQYVVATLADGSTTGAQLLATYADESTCALFQPLSSSAPLAFVSPCDLRWAHRATPPADFQTYRQTLRDANLVIERPPLDGVIYILVGNDCHHRKENGMGNFAWDIVRPDAEPSRHDADGCPLLGDPRPNESYAIWGDRVVTPVDGVVYEIANEVVDNAPGVPNLQNTDGNMVGIQLQGQPLYLYLLHLQKGSIPHPAYTDPTTGHRVPGTCEPDVPGVPCIVPGAALRAGTMVGLVGNSGQSVLPHLHMSLLWADPQRSWSVPVEWRKVFVSGVRSGGIARLLTRPQTGQYVSGDLF